MDIPTLVLAKKYARDIKIDLTDYGVDVFALFVQGGGEIRVETEKAAELIKIENTPKPITFVIKKPEADVYIECPVSKLGKNETYIHTMTATIPIEYNNMYCLGHLYVSPIINADAVLVKLVVEMIE